MAHLQKLEGMNLHAHCKHLPGQPCVWMHQQQMAGNTTSDKRDFQAQNADSPPIPLNGAYDFFLLQMHPTAGKRFVECNVMSLTGSSKLQCMLHDGNIVRSPRTAIYKLGVKADVGDTVIAYDLERTKDFALPATCMQRKSDGTMLIQFDTARSVFAPKHRRVHVNGEGEVGFLQGGPYFQLKAFLRVGSAINFESIPKGEYVIQGEVKGKVGEKVTMASDQREDEQWEFPNPRLDLWLDTSYVHGRVQLDMLDLLSKVCVTEY